MTKLSAGILAFHHPPEGKIEILLVHPGGPFWKNKDLGAWSIPKGEYEESDDALKVAKREFREELGVDLPEAEFIPLTPLKIKSGKIISAWAIKLASKISFIQSNLFEMEWPPRSGRKQFFPEVDRAEWFTKEEARIKINSGQVAFLDQLETIIQ